VPELGNCFEICGCQGVTRGNTNIFFKAMSQNFKYVKKYLQMGGRILKPYTVYIKEHVKLALRLCFTKQKKSCRLLNIR
jgi:hypothetical protein